VKNRFQILPFKCNLQRYHAVNEDYDGMAGDFIRLGFLAPGTDVRPIVPALESIWQDARTSSLANFNFRTVTGAFNELVYQYPIRIPEVGLYKLNAVDP
jgi:predicted unusual protein kinase regulating ubiquinone biosynthesis (AarF/ABC1/UbiB family)